MFGISMFEDTEVCISKHTKSTAFNGLVQIMRQTIPNSDMGISPYALYHANKGLSSIPNMIVWIIKQGVARYRESIPDIKQSYIYKHYMRDIKVWVI